MKTLFLLKILPKNIISRLTGIIASVYLFPFLRSWLYGLFSRIYGINIAETELPLDKYQSFNFFFTRKLKAKSRKIPEKANILISPVDGTLDSFGKIQKETMLQAKGINYTVKELLQHEKYAKFFENGYYILIYLSPKDYHRVHAPTSGTITGFGYIPGRLWPVHETAVKNIQKLFAVNERVITYQWYKNSQKKEKTFPVASIMVGAFNVGKMSLSYTNFKTNSWWRQGNAYKKLTKKIHLKKGAELGIFNLGSTVILLIPENKFTPTNLKKGASLRMGQALGEFK